MLLFLNRRFSLVSGWQQKPMQSASLKPVFKHIKTWSISLVPPYCQDIVTHRSHLKTRALTRTPLSLQYHQTAENSAQLLSLSAATFCSIFLPVSLCLLICNNFQRQHGSDFWTHFSRFIFSSWSWSLKLQLSW